MLNKMRGLGTWGAVIVVFGALLTGCGSKQVPIPAQTGTRAGSVAVAPDPAYSGPVVATYAGGVLTKDELDQQYNLQVVLPGLSGQESKAKFLPYYVVWYKYLYGQAQATMPAVVDPVRAEQALNQTLSQLSQNPYSSRQDLENKMESLNLTDDDLLRLLEKGLYLQSYLQSQMTNLQVTNDQAEAYFQKNVGDFTQVTVDEILVDSESTANLVETKLKSGTDFNKLADEYSKDPSVAQNHGHLVGVSAGLFSPEPAVAQACETIPVGQFSAPIHTRHGYRILRVDQRQVQNFEQVKKQIQAQLLPQIENQMTQGIYDAALREAKIRVKAKNSDL